MERERVRKHRGRAVYVPFLLIAALMLFTACGSGNYTNDMGISPTGSYPKDLDPYDENRSSELYIEARRNDEYHTRTQVFSTSYKEAASKELEGVSYDPKTNTLTLTNYCDMEAFIWILNMGNDFTIKIVGSCLVGNIEIRRTSLRITGNGGTLMIYSVDAYTAVPGGNLYMVYGDRDALMIDGVNVFVKGSVTASSELEQVIYFRAPLKLADGLQIVPGNPDVLDRNGETAHGVSFELQ